MAGFEGLVKYIEEQTRPDAVWDCGGKALTREDIEAVMRPRPEQYPPRPCEHVVSRHANGWTFCAMCFAPLYIQQDVNGRPYQAEPPEADIAALADLML